jgi:predicted DNA-binding transcriptional regulator AlpA
MESETGHDVTTMLTVKQVARRLRVSIRSVWRRVQSGRLPPPLYPWPRVPRWPREAIEQVAMLRTGGADG